MKETPTKEQNICYCGNYGGGMHTRSARCPGGELRTPQGEPALTSHRELPGTREPAVIEPKGNTGESPASTSSKDVAQGPWWTPTIEVERLMRWCKDAKTATVEISAKVLEGLLHDSLLWRQDRLRAPVETKAAQAPIARIRVANDKIVDAKMLAPGLPTGVHSLYCEPEATAPYMRAVEPPCICEHGPNGPPPLRRQLLPWEHEFACPRYRVPEKASARPIPPGRMCNTHGNWNCSECCPPENGTCFNSGTTPHGDDDGNRRE